MDQLFDVLCVWCGEGVFESITLSDETLNFRCKVGVVLFSVASLNVVFVCIVEYGVEIVYCGGYVCIFMW